MQILQSWFPCDHRVFASVAWQARRLPKEILQKVVRSYFEAHEYPASLQRMVSSSPDEALPQFFSDPAVFSSLHPDMEDLVLPSWAAGPDDFIARHRCASATSAKHVTL